MTTVNLEPMTGPARVDIHEHDARAGRSRAHDDVLISLD